MFELAHQIGNGVFGAWWPKVILVTWTLIKIVAIVADRKSTRLNSSH